MKNSPKITPKGDNRNRASHAITLWVVNRSWENDKKGVPVCGVIESIKRTVYQMDGRKGQWVRYSNHYHPLHTREEFSDILADAIKRKYGFFNNELGGRGEAATHTELAPFIFYDEPGPLA